MVSNKNRNQAAVHPPPRGVVRLARRIPTSRESKAALTLSPGGVEAGADFCHLGKLENQQLVTAGLSHLSTRSIDPRERSDQVVEAPWIQSGAATCFEPTILTFDM